MIYGKRFNYNKWFLANCGFGICETCLTYFKVVTLLYAPPKNPNGVWTIDMESLFRVAVGVFYYETENTKR